MPRFLMTIRFDGTNYHGWQVQQNALAVQPVVQDALLQILGVRPGITGCSRTDSGVHANMYCFHFDDTGSIPLQALVKALNTKLPEDIAAIGCVLVPTDFHARYSVRSKEYIYQIYNGTVRHPLYRYYSYYVNQPLDVDQMQQGAQQFLGTHDFSAFCAAGSSVTDHVRTVMQARVERCGPLIRFVVCADGFLYNMVRIMAGTLIQTGLGKLSPRAVGEIVDSGRRENAGSTAPAHGLFLNRVTYPDGILQTAEIDTGFAKGWL